jgi:hypothetical protein
MSASSHDAEPVIANRKILDWLDDTLGVGSWQRPALRYEVSIEYEFFNSSMNTLAVVPVVTTRSGAVSRRAA